MKNVYIRGIFDNPGLPTMLCLLQASLQGAVHLILLPDEAAKGKKLLMTLDERLYMLQNFSCIDSVTIAAKNEKEPAISEAKPAIWAFLPSSLCPEEQLTNVKEEWCKSNGVDISFIQVPEFSHHHSSYKINWQHLPKDKKKVIVTGCYDYLHTGHVRFFEEAANYGNVIVIVGSDENVKMLKGKNHPLYSQEKRRFMAALSRHVQCCLIASGSGWLDAEPEIAGILPDCYIVNHDGDHQDKRSFCKDKGIEYIVLARTPKDGLPTRSSTMLRGY